MDFAFVTPPFIWALLGIAFLIIEFFFPGFVFFFFGLGAFLSSVFCLLLPQLSMSLQLIVFITGSLFFLLCLRKWVKNVFTGFFDSNESMPLNKDSYIGDTGVVAKPIQPGITGKIEFHGSLWPAVANEKLEKGEPVRIIEQDNITFTVEKLNKQE